MSRLIDELNRVARSTPQPIGFRTARPATQEPRILLIASLAQTGDNDGAADYVDGAHAALLHLAKSRLTGNSLQKIAASLPDMPWGVWMEDIDTKKLEASVAAGSDFVVFPATSRVSATPQDNKIGKILQVESSLSGGLLKTINNLPVDAVLATEAYKAESSIAWHNLINFQRLANLLAKPLLVTAPLNVTAGELKTLWEAGVDGVVVEAGTEPPAGILKDLRLSISQLAFPASRKRSKTEALLPYMGGGKSRETEDEEDYE